MKIRYMYPTVYFRRPMKEQVIIYFILSQWILSKTINVIIKKIINGWSLINFATNSQRTIATLNTQKFNFLWVLGQCSVSTPTHFNFEHSAGKGVGWSQYSTMKDHDPDLLIFLVPFLYREFPKILINNQEVISSIISCINPRGVYYLQVHIYNTLCYYYVT